MKFYDEKKIFKIRNILTVVSLLMLSILLFFKVYDYFEDSKPVTDAFEAMNDKVRKYADRLNSMLGPKERKKKFRY